MVIIPHNSSIAGHDIGLAPFFLSPFSASLLVYLLVFCVFLVRYYGLRRHLTHLSIPLLFSHRVLSDALTQTKSLIPPIIALQRPSSRSQSSSRLPFCVRQGPLFFLCDRRIALFCSGYSTTTQHVWMNNSTKRKTTNDLTQCDSITPKCASE